MSQVILLERVEKLGEMGDLVDVKPGYARNYLLPQGKALRATKTNIAYFEAEKKALESKNNEAKKDAEKLAKKIDGLKVTLIRQASESGQLFGSVNARDIADAITEKGDAVTRQQVILDQNYKMIGLFDVAVVLHPEVKVSVTMNIARSPEEAKIQDKTGKALIASDDDDDTPAPADEANAKVSERTEDMKEGLLEEDALKAEKEREAEASKLAEEEAAKAAAKAEKQAAAKAAAEAEEAEAETADAETAEETPEEDTKA